MLRDIEPYLKYVANGHAIIHNDRAKNGFVVLWNTDIDVRIDVYAASRKAKLLEYPRLDTLYIKVRLHSVHEPEPERFCCGKECQTRPRPMVERALVLRFTEFVGLFFFGPHV